MAIDYWIKAACYEDDNGEYIQEIKGNENNDGWGPEVTFEKREAVRKIQDGDTMYTIFKEDGEWKKGSKIHPYDPDDTPRVFLRTDRNDDERDNLGNITEYQC